VLVGIAAFLIHFYWTKIGVSEIWNTTKWSSMRSSFYRTIGRLNRRNKFASEQPLSNASIYSDDIDMTAVQNKKSTPISNSYITPSNNNLNKSVPMISYNNPVYEHYATKIGQPIETTKIHNTYEYNNSRSNDFVTMIEKQRF
jgi:hypothetical protein